jgi:hypothetical protein
MLMLLGSVGIRVGEIATGMFAELAEGFRQRVLRTPIVIDGDSA